MYKFWNQNLHVHVNQKITEFASVKFISVHFFLYGTPICWCSNFDDRHKAYQGTHFIDLAHSFINVQL